MSKTHRIVGLLAFAGCSVAAVLAGGGPNFDYLKDGDRKAMQERFERRYRRTWAEFELPQSVANIKAQALVIHDEGDRDVGFASGLALARAWPDARLLATKGLGHNRILRDPAVVADAIDFLEDRVQFAPPPRRGEASAFRDPAPLV